MPKKFKKWGKLNTQVFRSSGPNPMLLTNPDNEDPALSSEKYSFAYHQAEILHLQLTKQKKEKEKEKCFIKAFFKLSKGCSKVPHIMSSRHEFLKISCLPIDGEGSMEKL